MYVTAIKYPDWIALEKSPGNYLHRICEGEYEKNSSHSHLTRPSTAEEIAHLDACIKAGKYVPFDESMVTINYEIY